MANSPIVMHHAHRIADKTLYLHICDMKVVKFNNAADEKSDVLVFCLVLVPDADILQIHAHSHPFLITCVLHILYVFYIEVKHTVRK